MNFSSQLLADTVSAFSSLPGIGPKTALRLALYLMNEPFETSEQFSKAIVNMRRNIKKCKNCFNVSDQDLCGICTNPRREDKIVCVVETVRDVMAVEATGQFQGKYHVLGGVISPIEGIGPEQLKIQELIDRIEEQNIEELIMAISPTIEGDTTIFYLSKQVEDKQVNLSTIARGISFGGELEYADELTLGRSIATRQPYTNKE